MKAAPFQAIETLCQYGFQSDSLTSSREALKCLANILLLESKTRQIFVDLGHATNAAEKLKVSVFYNLFIDPDAEECLE